MSIVNPYDWRVISERPGKRVLARVDPTTDEVVICEEWLEDVAILQAKQMRELPPLVSPDLKPLAVVPDSVMSKAIKEGWSEDQKQWEKWASDIDNRKLSLR